MWSETLPKPPLPVDKSPSKVNHWAVDSGQGHWPSFDDAQAFSVQQTNLNGAATCDIVWTSAKFLSMQSVIRFGRTRIVFDWARRMQNVSHNKLCRSIGDVAFCEYPCVSSVSMPFHFIMQANGVHMCIMHLLYHPLSPARSSIHRFASNRFVRPSATISACTRAHRRLPSLFTIRSDEKYWTRRADYISFTPRGRALDRLHEMFIK